MRLEDNIFSPGDYIIRAGQEGDCMFFIIKVRQRRPNRNISLEHLVHCRYDAKESQANLFEGDGRGFVEFGRSHFN